MLEQAVRLTLDGTHAERAFLILKDEKTGSLVPRIARTRDNKSFPPGTISRTILNRVMSERVSMLASNAQLDQRLEQPDHALRALKSAQAMRRTVSALNASTAGPTVELRIALNSGVALAGDLGSARRRDYTVLGDVVKTASRVQTHVTAPGQILITRATRDRLPADVSARSLGPAALRGRREPVEVLEVDG